MIMFTLLLTACTEDAFRETGHGVLSGMCAKSSSCTVNCPEGQAPDDYGHCVLHVPR